MTTGPKITKAARGSLIHFVKGHLLERSFDITYFHCFGVEKITQGPDYELFFKSPLPYLSEKELILLINYKCKQVNNSIEETHNKGQIQLLEWCESFQYKKQYSPRVKQSIAITKAHTLFLLALKSENSIQRKMLKLALSELTILEGSDINTHPYLFYLRGLLFVALDNWQEATSQFHQASAYTHNPSLYLLLTKLYIHLDMPKVSSYFKAKLDRSAKIDKELTAS